MKCAVEECIVWDISHLIRTGVFQAAAGTPCNYVWSDPAGHEIHRVNFWVEGNTTAPYLRMIDQTGNSSWVPTSSRIELALVPCRLPGVRRLFRCPGDRGDTSCSQRAQKLYLIEDKWKCRNCGDLTYLARRQHDRRKDILIRSPEALSLALQSNNPRKKLLGVGAWAQAAARLRKQAAPQV